MANVKISALHKSYGPVHAVRGHRSRHSRRRVHGAGRPSGCGKSTLLRAIAGLEDVEQRRHRHRRRGRQRDAAARPRRRHGVPGLRPLSAHDRLRQYRPQPARPRNAEAGDRDAREAGDGDAGHRPLLGRYPRQLSGGQRQRVAIGRAIVRNPRVFLFDEPLSNLDAQLRDEMRGEIKRLHQEIATTMIYVTHDQIEAMTLADRIVLMRDGDDRAAGRAARSVRAAGDRCSSRDFSARRR